MWTTGRDSRGELAVIGMPREPGLWSGNGLLSQWAGFRGRSLRSGNGLQGPGWEYSVNDMGESRVNELPHFCVTTHVAAQLRNACMHEMCRTGLLLTRRVPDWTAPYSACAGLDCSFLGVPPLRVGRLDK